MTVPFVVVMTIGPEAALAGNTNESVPAEMMPNETTAPPPMVTSGCGDYSFNPDPDTVTSVFVGPKPGEKLEMLGRILKSVADDCWANNVPLGGRMMILPLGAFAGTATRIVVLLDMVKSLAEMPPKVMPEQPMKLPPVRITFVPERPEAGEKLVKDAWAKKFVAVVTTLLLVLKVVPDFA